MRKSIGELLNNGRIDSPDESQTSAELSAILCCPNCSQIPELPITMCENGHTVCQNCRLTLEKCAVRSCAAGLTNIRNFVSESIIKKTSFKCKFSEQGCEAQTKGIEIHKHIASCRFRTIPCNLKPCLNNQVGFQAYVLHLRSHHGIPGKQMHSTMSESLITQSLSGILQRQHEMLGITGEGSRPVYYISYSGEIFFLKTMVVNDMAYWWVTLLHHTEEKSAKYRSRLLLRNRNLEVVSWNGLLYSCRAKFETVKQSTTAVIPLTTLRKVFGNPNRGLESDATENSDVSVDGENFSWNITLSIEDKVP